MKKIFCIILAGAVSACSFLSSEPEEVYVEPDYNYIADHVIVVDKSSRHVVYEYTDIRVDEIAPVAAIYCANRGGRQASLYDITLRPDHRRRATFVCEEPSDY